MGFGLNERRDIDEELRRVLGEQYERASGALEGFDVHRLRTSCKRARAVLRMIGNPKKDKALRRMDGRTRMVAKSFADERNDEVLEELTRTLAKACSVDAGPVVEACAFVRIAAIRQDPIEEHRLLDELRSAAFEVEIPASAPWPGVGRVYKRAREGMPGGVGASAAALHDWRGSAKRHWYHVRLLRRAWPAVVNVWADELDRLCELLGDHHDLVMLGERLSAVDIPEAARLIEEARRRQGVMERKSLAIGAHAFAPEPAVVVEWFKSRWGGG